ncbi:hypothetical protein GLOTRDRAFT_94974 [Gloeophyllum trabeum ATCC 11539]|uniref:Uncharacterized protein n=1 Tax=Gloeophyllum trabeum (strain ATCC 11539 / FP-39264 / Madison 617) TaxID=670483 RepID=S7RHU6_GLOTA|nr:uncharacterized protein GLOTRDRAFT_94974 [Gloeophyllum trabeum ATCC 11539]EPQ53860.1 hypothetical protein GLOTRDRAFT_94974 [Gloeophyllum trabeum ATCC 11539]
MRARYDGIGDPGVSRPPGCDFVHKVFDPERRELGQLFLEKDLGTLVVEDNAPLTACLIKLGEMAVSMYEHPVETLLPEEKRAQFFAEHRNKMTHESFISTIQGALDADGWPDEVADGPIPYLNIVKDTKYFALLAFKQMVNRPRVIRRALPEKLQEAEQPTVPGDQEAIPERKSRERNTRGKEAAAMARPAQKRRKDQKRKVAQDEGVIITGTRHRRDPGSAGPVAPKKRKQVAAGEDEARAGSRKKRARQTDMDAIATRTRAAVKKTEASRRQSRRGKV